MANFFIPFIDRLAADEESVFQDINLKLLAVFKIACQLGLKVIHKFGHGGVMRGEEFHRRHGVRQEAQDFLGVFDGGPVRSGPGLRVGFSLRIRLVR
jgi:hypothetical protein